MKFTATVVDLVPGSNDNSRPDSDVSMATGATIFEAEDAALSKSASNCDRRVYVTYADTDQIVRGPYILRAGQTPNRNFRPPIVRGIIPGAVKLSR